MVVLPRLPPPTPPPPSTADAAAAVDADDAVAAAYEVDDGLLVEARPWPAPPLPLLLRLLWFAVAVVVVTPWLMTAESLLFADPEPRRVVRPPSLDARRRDVDDSSDTVAVAALPLATMLL